MRNNNDIPQETEIVTDVIILAGGNSSRMEYPKVWLPFDEEQTILEHIVSEYNAFGCKKIVVVLNKSFIKGYSDLINRLAANVIVIRNSNPNQGRIHSLKMGISQLNRAGRTFIHNVDNPYADYSTLTALLKQHFFDYARPVHNDHGGHPILVSNKILERITHADDDEILRDILNEFNGNKVSVYDENVLCNINTPEEYMAAFDSSIVAFESAQSTIRDSVRSTLMKRKLI